MCKCGARAGLVSDCSVCLAARERRLYWRRRAENGVQHDKPRLGWSLGPMIIVNYIIGIWTHFGATIHGDAARRLERQARVQTVNPDLGSPASAYVFLVLTFRRSLSGSRWGREYP